jgi:hypothetical protein
MRWYWESSHYKKELGDLVLDRVFGYAHPGRTVNEDFGVRLSSGNIEPHLERIRDERARWLAESAGEAAEIHAAAQKKGRPVRRALLPAAGV